MLNKVKKKHLHEQKFSGFVKNKINDSLLKALELISALTMSLRS
jgi:hypothetical protein